MIGSRWVKCRSISKLADPDPIMIPARSSNTGTNVVANVFPVKSNRLPHPQLVDVPFTREEPYITLTFPQSHWQSHFDSSLCKWSNLNTVQCPNRLPVKSSRLGNYFPFLVTT